MDPNATTESSEKDSTTTAIVVTVIVVVVVVLVAVLGLILVRNHHMYDEVYGSAGRGIYANPVYGGVPPPGAGGVENFLGVGQSQEFAAAPPLAPSTTAAPKKGLIRQESMC